MAKYGVMLLGGLLMICGFASAWTGIDIVQIERGWTQVIAGVTALAGGAVTLSVGLLIGAVENLQESGVARRSYASRTGRLEVSQQPEHAPLSVASPVPAGATTIGATLEPVLQASSEGDAPAVAPESPLPQISAATKATPPIKVKDSPKAPDAMLPDTEAHDPALEWLRSAPRATPGMNTSALKTNRWDATASGAAAPASIASAKNRPAELRRYEANGVQYTLYADGSIDSDSSEGLLHFANMDALKAHLIIDDTGAPAAGKVTTSS